jgi:acetyl-CoA carboxylase biotin carboxyl carrier protein
MSQPLDFLNDDEVRQINSLVDTLDRSNFDYFQIDIGDIKVTIGKGAPPAGGMPAPAAPAAVPQIAPAAAPVAAAQAAQPAQSAPAAGAPAAGAAAAKPALAPPQAGWQPITATTMGRFYSKPDPNSAPYVKVGDRVEPDATVGLIEVMKLFNAVPAGVSGTIAQVCVQDAAVVEYGQVLFYVQP